MLRLCGHSELFGFHLRCCGAFWAHGAGRWNLGRHRRLIIAALSDGLLRTVEGTITAAGPIRNNPDQIVDDQVTDLATQRVDLRVSTIEKVDDYEDIQTPVDGAVRLTVRWPANSMDQSVRAFHCGERVRAVARLLPPQVYRDPGAWSRADYLLDQGITSTATVTIDRVESLGAANDSSFACRIAGWQQVSSSRLLTLPDSMRRLPAALRLSGDDAVMLAAMTTGDRTYLTHSLRVGFERTGSFHMLVVSGFHLAIVAGCLFWLARRLRLPRVPATFITIAASFAYALFTGFATPVQRSLFMVTLYLLGSLLYRERSPLNTIGFASLCLLAASPRSLFDSGLQMTLLAVVSIGGVAVPLLQKTVHPVPERRAKSSACRHRCQAAAAAGAVQSYAAHDCSRPATGRIEAYRLARFSVGCALDVAWHRAFSSISCS